MLVSYSQEQGPHCCRSPGPGACPETIAGAFKWSAVPIRPSKRVLSRRHHWFNICILFESKSQFSASMELGGIACNTERNIG